MLRTPTLPASPRPRGAQPGNTNALKFGFYSPRFREKDLADLEGHTFDGLADEILMLRVFMRRVMDFTGEVTTLDQAMELMRVLSLSSMAIARLSRIQLLFPHEDDFARLLNDTIEEVLAEIRAEEDPDAAYSPIEVEGSPFPSRPQASGPQPTPPSGTRSLPVANPAPVPSSPPVSLPPAAPSSPPAAIPTAAPSTLPFPVPVSTPPSGPRHAPITDPPSPPLDPIPSSSPCQAVPQKLEPARVDDSPVCLSFPPAGLRVARYSPSAHLPLNSIARAFHVASASPPT
jgi:hypothetical protein